MKLALTLSSYLILLCIDYHCLPACQLLAAWQSTMEHFNSSYMGSFLLCNTQSQEKVISVLMNIHTAPGKCVDGILSHCFASENEAQSFFL